MSQILINTLDTSFVSLSAEEANWWKKASPARRKAYVSKHPKSKYAKAVESGKLDVDAPTEGKSDEQATKTKSNKTKKTQKASQEKASENIKVTKPPVKKVSVKEKQSRTRRAKEAVIEQEEQKRIERKTPVIQDELRTNFSKVRDRITDIADKLSSTLSERAKADVGSFAKSFLQKKFKLKDASESQKRGLSKVGQILDGVTEGLIGRERYNSTSKTMGHVLLSLFLGPTNYKGIRDVIKEGAEGMESNSRVVRRKREQVDPFILEITSYFDSLVYPRLASLAAKEEPEELEEEPEELEEEPEEELEEEEPEIKDTLTAFIESYVRWFQQLDVNRMASKMAELEAVKEMHKEGYKPDPQAVQNLLDEEDIEVEIPDEVNMFESESATRPRISFRVCPKQKRKAKEERNKFDIVYDGRTIGSLLSDKQIPGNGKARRSWKARLYEGFNETEFVSGRSDTQPYTIVNSNRILLMNPVHTTFDESRNWIKHVIHKDFL